MLGASLKTDAELQTPTGYTVIYGSSWNINVDDDTNTGDASGNDDPWDFGTGSQYPILKFGNLHTRFDQRDDKLPTFGSAKLDDQTWFVGAAPSTIVPTASGGDGALTYLIYGTLPDGVTFNADGTFSGAPTAIAAGEDYVLAVIDEDGDLVALRFRIEVREAPQATLALTPASISENGGVSTVTAKLDVAFDRRDDADGVGGGGQPGRGRRLHHHPRTRPSPSTRERPPARAR